MTLGGIGAVRRAAGGCFCSGCGAKMMPYFCENAVVSQNQIDQIISESFLTVKGAALFLPHGNGSSPSTASRVTQHWNKHTGDLQQHLQTMFTLLRPEDSIRLAVRLESAHPRCTRYMVVVSTNGRQDTEESVVLGIDFRASDSMCTVGLVLPLWSDTLIHLDGDGGFSVTTVNRVHIFKPVSVQAMWSALQSLHKACEVARCNNYYPGSLFLTWVSYYQSRVASDQACINEWNAMQDVQSHRADSPVLFANVPTERERTERLIKVKLREIMMQKDLENVTSKEIRTELEMQMGCNLREFKEFIDNEMIVILGQMDSPTEIFDHVYLGSEWNASNLEELQNSGVRYILNMTREIDNFFPGMFEYHNIRVYDEEATNLLEYWNDTYKFISKAKKAGAKCLVHCKMGVSRSASTVIAYAMKEYGWDLERAFDHVKERRTVTKPNPSFMRQLEEYQGILLASKQRHNKLWRSHSDSDLSECPEATCKPPHNNNSPPPSLQDILGMAVLQALTAETVGVVVAADGDNVGVLASSSESNGLGDTEETPSSSPLPWEEAPNWFPLPRPEVATVVPEERAGASLPAPDPILPQSLPPAPEPKLETSELQMAASSRSKSSTSVPEQNLELLPASNTEPAALGPNEMLLLHSSSEQNGSPASVGTSMMVSPLSLSGPRLDSGPQISDDNNNPTGAANVPGSSRLSMDSIDFFSAREKFISLSQDGRACLLAEQAPPRTAYVKSPSQDMLPLTLEDLSGVPSLEEQDKISPHSKDHREVESELSPAPPRPQKENGVSVRHIVTELESVLYPVYPVSQQEPRAPSQEGGQGDEPEEAGCLSPSSHPDFLSTPPPDWLSGSVRRATKQLEQKLKQELFCPSTACQTTLPTARMDCPITVQQNEEGDSGVAVKQAQERECKERDGMFVHENIGLPDPSTPIHPSGCTNSEPLPTVVHLEGVTELETDVDELWEETPQPGDRLRCSSQDLEKIQATLWELQAFLREAGGAGGAARAGQEVPEGEEAESVPNTLQQRAVELEARILQAGLTPPCLMKRSASLAKWDHLELSTNDLCDWDHCSQPTSPSPPKVLLTPASHSCSRPAPDDASKKQCVLPLWPHQPCSACDDCPRTAGSQALHPNPNPDHDTSHSTPGRDKSGAPDSYLAVRPQHGRAHPLRRPRRAGDKKRIMVFVYNTL